MIFLTNVERLPIYSLGTDSITLDAAKIIVKIYNHTQLVNYQIESMNNIFAQRIAEAKVYIGVTQEQVDSPSEVEDRSCVAKPADPELEGWKFLGWYTEAVYETTTTGNSAAYSIDNVEAGTYTLKVMKANHVTREYAVTVGSSAVTQNVKIHPLGDVNGDGKVTTADAARINAHAKGASKLW